MLRHHLLVTLRQLRRRPGYTLIMVVSLAVGLGGALVLALHVRAEGSYDRHYPDADRLVRVTTTAPDGTAYATTVPALAPTLAADLAGVEHATRFLVEATESSESLFAVGEHRFYESRFAWADSGFFAVFPLPFLEGEPQSALARPFTVVLTETTARKYFGEGEAVGQTLRWNEQLDLEVTGVVADMPERSHFHFDLLASLDTFKGLGADGMIDNWGYRGFYTYLRLADDLDMASIESEVAALGKARADDLGGATLALQPVPEIHLRSHLAEEIEPNGYEALVRLFGALAGILLFIAGVNFVNLTTARSLRRAREVGVRKAVGAHRFQLVRQFLMEAVLLAVAAAAVALALMAALGPALSGLTGTPIELSPSAVGMTVALALLVGGLAGLYPAFRLSSFRPVEALRGAARDGRGGSRLRAGLVVTQFALSIALLVGTVLVYQQLRYLQTADLGFDHEQVVALPLHNVFGQPQQDTALLKQELLRLPSVEAVSVTSQLPTRAFVNNVVVRPDGAASDAELTAFAVGPDFLPAFGFELVQGRALGEASKAGPPSVLLNEAAVRAFGWTDPVGRRLFAAESGAPWGTVVGVVKDFHFQSMREAVSPVVFRVGQPSDFQYLVARVNGGDLPATIGAVQSVWEAGSPAWPFAYLFLDDAFDAMYRSVARTGQTVGLFALLAVLIAGLGLVGMTAYAVEQRTKEFGIRRVLGASGMGIAWLLVEEHLRLVGVAFVLAIPLTLWAATQWLADFAYGVGVGPAPFVLALAAAVTTALVALGVYAFRAATTDPVQSLRYE